MFASWQRCVSASVLVGWVAFSLTASSMVPSFVERKVHRESNELAHKTTSLRWDGFSSRLDGED